MSKIYEALLRAEKERDNKTDAASNVAKSSASAVLDQPIPEPKNTLAAALVQVADNQPAPTPEIIPRISAHAAVPPPSAAPAHVNADARPAFPAPLASPTWQPLSDRIHENQLTESAAAPEPSVSESTEIVVSPEVAPFDFSAIATRVWQPQFSRLPALGERGSGVEQFRSLRSRMFEFRDLNKLKSVLVSSGMPQEGKSFVTANLAVAFARHKASRVLLIDGDMRRSSQHKIFGAPNEVGLSEYLSGQATLLEVMQRPDLGTPDAPFHPGLASLTLIPGGADSEKAADLSGNRRFDHLIATLAPHFDWIIVDSSPVNLVADAVNLSRACDGVLLIARGGVTKYQTAQKALGELKASRILGFVINAVANPSKTPGYYGYDGYDPHKEEAELATT